MCEGGVTISHTVHCVLKVFKIHSYLTKSVFLELRNSNRLFPSIMGLLVDPQWAEKPSLMVPTVAALDAFQ